MYLKPYFYYRQKYPVLNKSTEDSINSAENDCKEETSGANSVSQTLDQAERADKQAGDLISGPDQEENLDPKLKFEHSRFLEVAPGVFQFKHTRPNNVQHLPEPMVNRYVPEILARPSQPDKKPEVDEFVRIGRFPGASDYGLPVYQFT
ncbi:MAG: hypothetical protein PHT62_01095 [Desulfotomaculaceae bacterium]|nr:hypothetical protein [Desulfotomaculaceae bacterium]